MVDRSVWWRTGTGVAAWLVLAVATAGVAWAAVGVVSDQGDDPAPVAVPAAARTSGSTPSNAASGTTMTDQTPETSGSPSPSDDPSETEDTTTPVRRLSSRVLGSPGGTVSVECTGSDSIRLVYATPADGWRLSLEESGPDEIEVEFLRGDDDELRTRARCESGAVEGEAEVD